LKGLEIDGRLKGSFLIVSLMSAGGKGLEDLRRIKERLKEMGIIAVIAKDYLPKRCCTIPSCGAYA
jgi:predicted ABC-class ATPase